MYDENTQIIIIDNGTEIIRAGFGGHDKPHIILPTIIGRPRHPTSNIIKEKIYIGDEVLPIRGKSNVHCCEHPIILTEPACALKSNREKLVQMFFEHFNFPGVYISNEKVNSLYASGRTTGIVLDCGISESSPVPIYEGNVLQYCVGRPMPLGGTTIDDILTKMLSKRGYSFFEKPQSSRIAKDIKEKLCYIAFDYEQEINKAKASPSAIEKNYQLPDGQTITIEEELFRSPEILFEPREFELPGSTLFPGFDQRLEKEMKSLVQSGMNVQIITPSNKRYSSWLGASILASVSTSMQLFITKQEYNEYGPSIVHQKCF